MAEAHDEKIVKKNDWVSVSYAGKLQTGEIFDQSREDAPLIFKLGDQMVIKGFEENIAGMKVGEEKEFTISAKDAYGEMTEEHKEDVPKEAFKEIPDLAVGLLLLMESPDHGMMKGRVLSIKEDAVTISINHPLAGEDLTFSVKVEKILTEKEGETFRKKMLRMQQLDDDCDHDAACEGCSDCHQ